VLPVPDEPQQPMSEPGQILHRVARPEGHAAASGVMWRAVVLGLVLIPPNALWLHSMELVWGSGTPTRLALLFNAVFILVLLALPNLVLSKYWPRWALRPAELVTIYAMLCLATAIGGRDFLETLVATVATPAYFATPENQWQELFLHKIPASLIVKDPVAAEYALFESTMVDSTGPSRQSYAPGPGGPNPGPAARHTDADYGAGTERSNGSGSGKQLLEHTAPRIPVWFCRTPHSSYPSGAAGIQSAGSPVGIHAAAALAGHAGTCRRRFLQSGPSGSTPALCGLATAPRCLRHLRRLERRCAVAAYADRLGSQVLCRAVRGPQDLRTADSLFPGAGAGRVGHRIYLGYSQNTRGVPSSSVLALNWKTIGNVEVWPRATN